MQFDLLKLLCSHHARHHIQNYTNGSYGLLIFLHQGLDSRLAYNQELHSFQTLLDHLFSGKI